MSIRGSVILAGVLIGNCAVFPFALNSRTVSTSAAGSERAMAHDGPARF
jgi:hypothetical protein